MDTTPAPVPNPVKLLPPKAWAERKAAQLAVKYSVDVRAVPHLVAGAYQHGKWERDHTGADMSLVSEQAFDDAVAAVATISISSNPKER